MLGLRRARARSRLRLPIIGLTLVIAGLGPGAALAGGSTLADPRLSTTIEYSGTGSLVTAVRTDALRARVPMGTVSPRILLIGTGVDRHLFPPAVQPSIIAPGAGAADPHGYGTMAASVIFQLLPRATVTSWRVRAYDSPIYDYLDSNALADALEKAQAQRDSFDLILFALPPQGALDPISHMISRVNYGERHGKGMTQVVEALLANKPRTDGPASGIPIDRKLRDDLFARANFKQRDAVERYALQAQAWRRVLKAVSALSGSGVTMVAPAGDFTYRVAGTVVPLATQTAFGVTTLPEIISVGASYLHGGRDRVSPTSGRGPTLALGAKPDLLAPADVMGMLPVASWLPWKDDSTRVPLENIEWAMPGVSPSMCPSIPAAYRCVLQGSSMVSASLVAANLATLVANGVPHAAATRAAPDNEILRGIAWGAASAVPSLSSNGDRTAYPWEQGAGVVTGLRGLSLPDTPVLIGRPDIGEVGWNQTKTKTVSLWSGGAPVVRASAPIHSYIGPDESGAAVSRPYSDPKRVTAAPSSSSITLTVGAGEYQGGIYGGDLVLTPPSGQPIKIPTSLTQDVPFDFHADYAYNEYMAKGAEGERVERATAALFAGVPTNVGLIGTAFKNFSGPGFRNVGGDPTNAVIIRYGTTKDSFTSTSVPGSEHGRGRIDAVPPGFYKLHLLTDHEIEAVQARGRSESIGMRLASSGPDAIVTPGANLLIAAQPPCPTPAEGPLSTPCIPRQGELDPSTGLCVVKNLNTRVSFNLYCGEVAFAVPSAMISRAIHLVEHDAEPERSEWKTCGINVPLDGHSLDFDAIVNQAKSCPGQTTPTMWEFPAGAPGCLGPSERSKWPGGHPHDVAARYMGAGPMNLPGRNLPIGVMTYEFKLPYLNTYTTAGLSFSYVADNAIILVRFKTGSDYLGDASNGLVVIDDPDVVVRPLIEGAAARGSVYNEWTMMSANASVGSVSIVVIPTAWTRPDLDATKPVARVELCDPAMRISTYAKAPWGMAAAEGGVLTQHFPMLDRGLAQQVDPSVSRMRATFDRSAGAFKDAGRESEGLQFAIQVPKNTTRSASAPHHVRSPRGGPAYPKDARRYGTDGTRHESVLAPGYKTHDPQYGVTKLDCAEGAGLTIAEPDRSWAGELCTMFHAARSSDQLVAQLLPDMSTNGRFAGVLAIDHAAIRRGAGNVAFEIADADDGGAFDAAARWATSGGGYARRFPTGNFYDDVLGPISLSVLYGTVQVARDSNGNPVLQVTTSTAGGLSYSVSAALR